MALVHLRKSQPAMGASIRGDSVGADHQGMDLHLELRFPTMIHPNIDTTIIIHARPPVLSLATSTLATTKMRPPTGVRVSRTILGLRG